jgi:cysteinyl-tRNA synthetase
MANWSRRHTAVLAVFALFLQAKWCPPVDDLTNSVDKLVATAEQAVQTLGDQSVAWQDTLKNLQARLAADAAGLEGQIAEDVRGLITQIDTIAKDGVQFAQESVNCEIDFFRSHAKVTLQNLINALLN